MAKKRRCTRRRLDNAQSHNICWTQQQLEVNKYKNIRSTWIIALMLKVHGSTGYVRICHSMLLTKFRTLLGKWQCFSMVESESPGEQILLQYLSIKYLWTVNVLKRPNSSRNAKPWGHCWHHQKFNLNKMVTALWDYKLCKVLVNFSSNTTCVYTFWDEIAQCYIFCNYQHIGLPNSRNFNSTT